MGNQLSNEKKAIALMFICVIFWSTGGVLIKIMPWHPFMLTGVRSLIGAVIMLAYARAKKIKFEYDKFSLVIGIAMCVNMFLYVTSTYLTTAANAVMIGNATPIYLLIFGAIAYKKLPSKAEVFAVTCCFTGIALFFMDSLSGGGLLGNILAVFSGIARSGIYIAAPKTKNPASNMYGMISGHFLAGIIGISVGINYPATINFTTISAVLFLGVFQTGIAFLMYSFAIKNAKPLSCSLIAMLEPLLNPVWVAIFVGEIPGPMGFLGGAIVMSTIIWWCIRDSKKAVKS